MNANERRFNPRCRLKIPLRVQPVEIYPAPPELAESMDVSARGVYFETSLPLHVGAPLRVLLRMPEEITGKRLPEWDCRARVVRVDDVAGRNGRYGIGVEIQYYDVA